MTELENIHNTIKILERWQTDPTFMHVSRRLKVAELILVDIVINVGMKPELRMDVLRLIENVAPLSERPKIMRIKKTRELLGIGLKEAKNFVEHNYGHEGNGNLIT